MKNITAHELKTLHATNPSLALVDVRTPGEYQSVHVPGSLSHPVDSLNPAALKTALGSDQNPVYLMCFSGSRATQAAKKLEAAGFGDCVVITGGIEAWEQVGGTVERFASGVIPLPRQMQIIMGSIVVSSVLLSHFVAPGWIWVAGFVGCGLLMAGLTDYCPARTVLAKAPWNNRTEGCCGSGSCAR